MHISDGPLAHPVHIRDLGVEVVLVAHEIAVEEYRQRAWRLGRGGLRMRAARARQDAHESERGEGTAEDTGGGLHVVSSFEMSVGTADGTRGCRKGAARFAAPLLRPQHA